MTELCQCDIDQKCIHPVHHVQLYRSLIHRMTLSTTGPTTSSPCMPMPLLAEPVPCYSASAAAATVVATASAYASSFAWSLSIVFLIWYFFWRIRLRTGWAVRSSPYVGSTG